MIIEQEYRSKPFIMLPLSAEPVEVASDSHQCIGTTQAGPRALLQKNNFRSLWSMGNEWQTVPGPKSKAKQRASKASERQISGNENGVPADTRATDPAGAVLAQIDADWSNAKSQGSRPNPPSANGIGAFDKLEVDLKYTFGWPYITSVAPEPIF